MDVTLLSKERKDVLMDDGAQQHKYTERVYNFVERSTVVNRTLSALAYLAQRDTDGSIDTLCMDHGPSLRVLRARLADPVDEDDAEDRAAAWAFLVALMAKVRWTPDAA